MILGNFVGKGFAARISAALALGCLALGGVAGPALPQESKGNAEQPPAPQTVTTRTTTYDGWTVVCTAAAGTDKRTCSASFRIMNKEKNQNILVWLFGRNAKDEPLMELVTPTDVLIKPGVALIIDGGEPVKAEFVSCGTRGCKAALALDEDGIELMRSAKSVRIDLTRLDGQVIQFNFDVPGIGPALSDLGF